MDDDAEAGADQARLGERAHSDVRKVLVALLCRDDLEVPVEDIVERAADGHGVHKDDGLAVLHGVLHLDNGIGTRFVCVIRKVCHMARLSLLRGTEPKRVEAGDGNLAVAGVEHENVAEGRAVGVLFVGDALVEGGAQCLDDRRVLKCCCIVVHSHRPTALAPHDRISEDGHHRLEQRLAGAAKVALEGADKHSGVSRVSVLCNLAAEVAEEVHKVAEVEVVAHGRDLVVLALTVLLLEDTLVRLRERGRKALVELQLVVLVDARLCEAVQVLLAGRGLHEDHRAVALRCIEHVVRQDHA